MRDAAAPARLEALVREQAALRRVATLVAGDSEPARIFASVCEEVGRVLGVTTTNLVRFEESGRGTILGSWSARGAPAFPIAADLPMDGETVAPRVLRSGRPVLRSTPSLSKIDVTCFSTALMETIIRSAMARFERPWAISSSTSRSRGDSTASGSLRRRLPRIRTTTSGSSTEPPSPTRRTASANASRSPTRSLSR